MKKVSKCYIKPKLFSVMKTYTKAQLVKDLVAGVIVAIIIANVLLNVFVEMIVACRFIGGAYFEL